MATLAPLHHHAALIREGANDLGLSIIENIQAGDFDATLTDDELAKCARSLKHRLVVMRPQPPGFLKGSTATTVWLVPLLGTIALLTARPLAIPDVLPRSSTNALRDILGLWEQNGVTSRPLAVFFLAQRADLHAPNAITARGYARFRHRPRRFIPMAPTAGLTYNLDRRAARRTPGAPEVVATQVKLTDIVDIVACGCPDGVRMTGTQLMDSHRTYSNHLAEGRSFDAILDQLEMTTS